MRNLITILTEAELPPTATRVQTDLNIGVNRPIYHPPAPVENNDIVDTPPTSVPGHVSTSKPTVSEPMNDLSMSYLRDLANSDYGADDHLDAAYDALPDTPPIPQTLPAIISHEIAGQDFNPEWFMVQNLPGYIQNAIRSIGRMVFAPFTRTPIGEIQVISTLTNPEADVRKMMAWIRNNGEVRDQAELKMESIMPGYGAKVQVRQVAGCEFMLVSDHQGFYIYGYPASDALDSLQIK
jgi:hypothetical protein